MSKDVENIGKHLANARMKKNLSLEDISKKTKINMNILKNLEANDFENLPNLTYVRGFVKNYAKTVGIDIEESVGILEKMHAPTEHENVEEPTVKVKEESREEPAPSDKSQRQDSQENVVDLGLSMLRSLVDKRILIGLGVLVVVILIGKGIFGFFNSILEEEKAFANQQTSKEEPVKAPVKTKEENLFEMEAAKKIGSNEEASDTPEAKSAPKEVPEPKEIVTASPKVTEKEVREAVVKSPEEEKPEVTKLPDGKFPFREFYPAPTELYTPIEESNDYVYLPAHVRAQIDTDKENVYIVAVDGDSWLSFKVDEDKVKRFVLKQGKSLFIQGSEILVFMGNVHISRIFYNNKLLKVESKNGVKSLIFPEEEARNWKLPLFPSHNGVPYSQRDYMKNMAQREDA